MVVFGLFRSTKNSSRDYSNTLSIEEPKERDVLDELMGLNATRNNTNNHLVNSLDTSSFNLDDVIHKLSEKRNTNYKDALLNSLFSQVDFLRQESMQKNELIKTLTNVINNSSKDINNVEIMRNSTLNESSNLERDNDVSDFIDQSHESDVSVGTSIETRVGIEEQLGKIRSLKQTEYYNSRNNNGQVAEWENYTTGFGRKLMKNMGYPGGGLEKLENGTVSSHCSNQKRVLPL